MEEVTSTCIYCGCGCKLDYYIERDKIKRIKGNKDDDVSLGKPCIRGLTIGEVVNEERLEKPMIRGEGELKEATWEEAYQHIYDKVKGLSPNELFLNMSGKVTNEDSYVLQKLGRACLETNNIDSCCGRLCHAATVEAMKDCLGAANMTRISNLDKIDTLLIIGSNPATTYPVFFNNHLMPKKDEIEIISVQSMANKTSSEIDEEIVLDPGTDVAFLNGVMKKVINSGEYKEEIEDIKGFKRLKSTVEKYTEDYVEETCGLDPDKFNEIAEKIKKSNHLGIFHGMGFTQHVNGLEDVHSLLNLMMLKKGKVLTLRGEINVQGVGDISCVPGTLPSGPLPTTDELEEKWKCEISEEKGKSITEALLISPVKAAFISSFNPAQSMPNLEETHRRLKDMFLVVMSPYPNKTTEFADVVLPTPVLIERKGTITNGERRVRKVNQVKHPKEESKPEWIICRELSKFFDSQELFNYSDEKEIFEEITEIVPDYKALDPDKIFDEDEDMFAKQEIKSKEFYPEEFEGVEFTPDEKYPYLLTTSRSPYSFLTGESTSRSETLNKLRDEPCFYMNPQEMEEQRIKEDDEITIESTVYSLSAPVKPDNGLPRDLILSRFHSSELLINKLMPTRFDEETFTPNYKGIAVRIKD